MWQTSGGMNLCHRLMKSPGNTVFSLRIGISIISPAFQAWICAAIHVVDFDPRELVGLITHRGWGVSGAAVSSEFFLPSCLKFFCHAALSSA